MEAVREKWTDERLDDLSRRVEAGFTEARAELRAEMAGMQAEMNSRFNTLQQTTIGGFVVLLAAMFVTSLG